MGEVYAFVEAYRRKLLSIAWTTTELRQEAWNTEDELYQLEEALLKFTDSNEKPDAQA